MHLTLIQYCLYLSFIYGAACGKDILVEIDKDFTLLTERDENIDNKNINVTINQGGLEDNEDNNNKDNDYQNSYYGGCYGKRSPQAFVDSTTQKRGLCSPIELICNNGGCLGIDAISYGCRYARNDPLHLRYVKRRCEGKPRCKLAKYKSIELRTFLPPAGGCEGVPDIQMKLYISFHCKGGPTTHNNLFKARGCPSLP